jgi:peptide/nickel transport system permease protein
MSSTLEAVRGPVAMERPASSERWRWLRLLFRRKIALIGAILVTVNVIVAVLAPAIGRWDPLLLDVKARLAAPSATHWFGTDDVGRDVWSRVIYGARLSMIVGVSVVLFSFVAGIVFGLLGGYYRRFDNVLMRVMDGIMAFPGIILAIALMASLGPSVVNVIVALGIVYVPRVARIVRGSVLVIRETPYVEAALALGVGDVTVLWKHILPNCLSPVIVQGTFIFAAAVLGEAALSFLGVGVPPQIPSWGNVLAEGRLYLQQAPWLTLFPGAAIMACILGLKLFGDGLRDLLAPGNVVSRARSCECGGASVGSRSEAREEVVTKVEREPGGEKGPYARRRPKAGREA